MAVEQQEYDDDQIIKDLELTEDVRPAIPPLDVVYGHFQKVRNNLRLYHESWSLYMECPLGRLVHKGKGSRNRSQLHLRADGNYDDEVFIGYTSLFEPEGTEPVESTHQVLYARYARAKTTPWHE